MRNYLSRGLRPKIGEIPHIGSESLPPNGSNGQEMGRDGIIKSSLIAMVSLEYPEMVHPPGSPSGVWARQVNGNTMPMAPLGRS